MRKKIKTKKSNSINVQISMEAHKKMRNDGYNAVPRRNLREQVNFINNLKTDL